VAGFAEFASAVTSKASAANKSTTELTKSFKSLVSGSGDTDKALGKLGGSFGDMVAKAAPAEGIMGQVTSALSALGPEGQAAAAVLQVVTAAVTALVVTLWDWAAAAVAAAQRRDALVATFNALGQGKGAGEATLAATKALAASLPYTTSQVNAWAKSLMAAGIQGDAMERGVKAIAAASAVMGEQGGAAAENLLKRFAMTAEIGGKLKLDRRLMNALAQAGVSAATLAAELGVAPDKLSSMSVSAAKLGDAMQKALISKGAGALANVGLTWDSIKAKFDEGVGSIFAGMSDAVRPFMQAIKDLFGEFNKGSPAVTVAGGVMKSVLTSVFSVAAKVINALHYGFLVVEVAALQLAIYFAPIVNGLRRIVSNATLLQGLKYMLIGLAIPFVIVAALVFGLAVAFGVVVAGIAAFAGAIVGAFAYAIGYIAGAIGQAKATVSEWASSAYEAAGNFVSGLVSGVVSGVGRVVSAAKGLAAGAVSAVKSALGIASPSRVMMEIGAHMAAGTAQGLDTGAPSVRAASGRMAGAGAGGAATANNGGRAGGSMSVTFAPGSIVIDGAGKSAMEITEEMVALVFERLAATQGLATS
jgi:hypothetical protein